MGPVIAAARRPVLPLALAAAVPDRAACCAHLVDLVPAGQVAVEVAATEGTRGGGLLPHLISCIVSEVMIGMFDGVFDPRKCLI